MSLEKKIKQEKILNEKIQNYQKDGYENEKKDYNKDHSKPLKEGVYALVWNGYN